MLEDVVGHYLHDVCASRWFRQDSVVEILAIKRRGEIDCALRIGIWIFETASKKEIWRALSKPDYFHLQPASGGVF